MTNPDFRMIGERLATAFRLKTLPLAVYGSPTPPGDAVHLAKVNRCFAVTLFRMATGEAPAAIFAGAESPEGCCPGGLAHMGFFPEPDDIPYFVSTGRADIRGGAAEYLKSSPEMVRRCFSSLGKITPPGKYLVVRTCASMPGADPGTRSLCVFGTAEQVRNMAALVHFDRDNPFTPVIVPWGPSCSTFISYPAGMVEHAPPQSAFMGPQDPTQNHGLPPDLMAIGIPARVVAAMADNLDASFVVRRPGVAFPNHTQ